MSTPRQQAKKATDAVKELATTVRELAHPANFLPADRVEVEFLPNGQMLLMDMPEGHEGADLLVSRDELADKYPLTTFDKNQERLQSIIQLLAADAPWRFICRAHRVGWHTLESIRAKQGTKIAAVKKVIAQRMSTFVQLGIEQLLDDLAAGRLDSDKLGVTLGIITDKLQVLTGEATVITGTAATSKPLTAETLMERLAKMKPAVPTGSSAGNISSNAADALVELGPDSQSGLNIRN
jgi:hypothetical protein